MKKQSSGFTVIEITFVILLLGFASILFFIQKNSIEVTARDNRNKTAINAMYYSLEEVFYPANKFYPRTIDSNNLKSMDPKLFTDTNKIKLGKTGSLYTYTPTNCTNQQCKSYTLKTSLEKEADFVKTSRNN